VNDGARPPRLVVVAGTGTEVGKTWVAAHVLRDLAATGVRVAARKPVQSFAPGDADTDAHVLAAASGEDRADVCPHHRWYEVPMAPPMAATVLGRPPFSIAELVSEMGWPGAGTGAPATGAETAAVDVGLIESAGGVRSPLAADGDTVALVEALQPDIVVLVADAGLGTINAVRLSMEALDHGAHVAGLLVHLNRYDGGDDLHRANHAWLVERDRFEVVTDVADLARRLRP
jgi:dethiobiotin synthetase